MQDQLALALSSSASPLGRAWADWAGMVASIGCAIHCAAMPLVIGYLPLLGLDWLAGEGFHQVMAAVCFVLAVSAFLPGWRKHGSLAPACVGATGAILLAIGAFGVEGACCAACTEPSEALLREPTCVDQDCQHCVVGELPLAPVNESGVGAAAWALPLITPLGGLLLIGGHLTNHRKSCQCSGDRCCLNSSDRVEA